MQLVIDTDVPDYCQFKGQLHGFGQVKSAEVNLEVIARVHMQANHTVTSDPSTSFALNQSRC
jgi:hypothetical protein